MAKEALLSDGCFLMKSLPQTGGTLLIRTDFSDQEAWLVDWEEFAENADDDGVFRGF